MRGITPTTTLAALIALTRVHGHMFVSSPPPIPDSAPKDPLDPSGSNFPCHGAALPSSGGEKMAAGSSQMLAFELGAGANTAVHGGGSCQMSITYETDPTKVKDPTNWKVIYSIEGGCPSNTKGNLDNGVGAIACNEADGLDCVNSYNFTIPKGVQEGHAIMAWTWFNTIGNREMYMNCINTEITGGDGSEMSALPPMFAANLASVSDCATAEQGDVKFPQPGEYIYKGKSQYPLTAPTGAGCGEAAAGGSSGDSSGDSSGEAAPAKPSAVLRIKTITQTMTAPAGQTSAPAAAPSTGAAGCLQGEVACPSPGDVVCVRDTSFGICNADNCAVVQPLAQGTQCRDGTIAKRDHVRRHLMNRRIGSHF